MEDFCPVVTLYAFNGGYVLVSLDDEEIEEQMSGFNPEGEVITSKFKISQSVNKSHVFVSIGEVTRFIERYLTNLDSDADEVEEGMRNG